MPNARNEGVRIHYEVEGSGPPIVMVHGAIANLEMWRELGYTDALCPDYRLILIDARAHGLSDKPHDPAQYGPEMMVGDVVAVLDELGLSEAHFVGASMGAAIGFQMVGQAPQRLKSLVLMGYGRYGPLTEPQQQFVAAGLHLFELGATMGGAAALAAVEQPGVPQPPELRAQFLANDWVALRDLNNAFNEWPGFEDILPQVAVPALVVITEFDFFYPSAQKCAEVMPHATFVGLTGGQHHQNSYGPEVVLPYLRAHLASVDQV